MLKGGHNKSWGSFYAVACSFSHIVGGWGWGGGGGVCGHFPLFKRWGAKILPCLDGGGGGKKFRTRDFLIL